jgi:hypothetical protein
MYNLIIFKFTYMANLFHSNAVNMEMMQRIGNATRKTSESPLNANLKWKLQIDERFRFIAGNFE